MKPNFLIAILTLVTTTAWSDAIAATDRSYYVTELAAQQKFDVYNDGRNTYLESIPGLVVTGATADGERYIVNGVPQQIRGFMNGKPITVIRGRAPIVPVGADTSAVNTKIAEITKKLDSLSAELQVSKPSGSSPVPPLTAQNSLTPAKPTTEANKSANIAGSPEAPTGKTTPQRPLPVAKAAALPVDEVRSFTAAPSDHVMRVVIERYARMVGWTAVWDVERDIPIGSAAEKTTDFKSAVRWILAATELGDLTVKPCFYNNAVVRVVRKTVKCNPND